MVLLKILCSFFIFFTAADQKIEFETKKIIIQGVSIKVAIADTAQKRKQGLMFVDNWDKYQGMLFSFKKDRVRYFWMKNTFLPLSIGFYGSDKKLFEIKKMNPAKSLAQKNVARVYSSKAAKYVLEVPQGWFKKHKIVIGSSFKEI